MNRAIFLCLALPLALAASFIGRAEAQTITDCRVIQTLGGVVAGSYGDVIDAEVAGTSYRINRRKTLRLHGVEGIRFSGCTAQVDLDVTLRRRIRRNAHGTISVAADVRLLQLDRDNRAATVCIYNPRVTRVRLSHTTGLGEAVYRWVANLALPGGGCDTFRY